MTKGRKLVTGAVNKAIANGSPVVTEQPTERSKADIKASLLAGFESRRVAIEAVQPEPGTFVLGWKDGSRFVSAPLLWSQRRESRKPQVVGFERATHFPSRKAAAEWVQGGLRDGAFEAPEVYTAQIGKRNALRSLKRATDQVASINI